MARTATSVPGLLPHPPNTHSPQIWLISTSLEPLLLTALVHAGPAGGSTGRACPHPLVPFVPCPRCARQTAGLLRTWSVRASGGLRSPSLWGRSHQPRAAGLVPASVSTGSHLGSCGLGVRRPSDPRQGRPPSDPRLWVTPNPSRAQRWVSAADPRPALSWGGGPGGPTLSTTHHCQARSFGESSNSRG